MAVGGASPRADFLLGAGDCYVIVPGACHRVQAAYVDESDFVQAPVGKWDLDEWPVFEAESVGQDLPTANIGATTEEIALSILSATAGEGRPTLKKRLTEYGLPAPGSDKARRLMALGRDVWEILKDTPELAEYCARTTD